MEMWREGEFEKVLERTTGIMKMTWKEKREECNDILSFLWHLFDLADIGQDIYFAEQVRIPYYISALTLRIYLEFQTNLFQGAYHSAGRSLRWLYEANLSGATACINPSLLDNQFEEKKSMELDEFEKWLRLYDEREGELCRRRIFEACGLPAKELQGLYSDLCKYIHISRISFDKKLTWPNIQYIPEKFDEIFALTKRTMDLVLWLECKMLLQYDKGTEGALRKVWENMESLTPSVPMTGELLSNLGKENL